MTAIKFPHAPEKLHKSRLFLTIVIAWAASPSRCIVFNYLEHLHEDRPVRHVFYQLKDMLDMGIGIATIFMFSSDTSQHFFPYYDACHAS